MTPEEVWISLLTEVLTADDDSLDQAAIARAIREGRDEMPELWGICVNRVREAMSHAWKSCAAQLTKTSSEAHALILLRANPYEAGRCGAMPAIGTGGGVCDLPRGHDGGHALTRAEPSASPPEKNARYVWIYDGEVWGSGSTPEEARERALAFVQGVDEDELFDKEGVEAPDEDEDPVFVDGFSACVTIEADNEDETREAVRVLVPDPE